MNPTDEITSTRMRLAFGFSFAFGVITIIVSCIAGALTFALVGVWGTAATVTLWGLLGGSLVIAISLVSALLDARWILIESVAAELDEREAERQALSGGKTTINKTQIDARGMGNAVEVNNAPVEKIRLVQVRTAGKLIEGIPAPALAFFIDQYDVRGWSQRAWIDQGIRLPGMKEPVDYDTWRQLVGILEKVEAIPPVQPRQKIKPIIPLETIKQKALGSGETAKTD